MVFEVGQANYGGSDFDNTPLSVGRNVEVTILKTKYSKLDDRSYDLTVRGVDGEEAGRLASGKIWIWNKERDGLSSKLNNFLNAVGIPAGTKLDRLPSLDELNGVNILVDIEPVYKIAQLDGSYAYVREWNKNIVVDGQSFVDFDSLKDSGILADENKVTVQSEVGEWRLSSRFAGLNKVEPVAANPAGFVDARPETVVENPWAAASDAEAVF